MKQIIQLHGTKYAYRQFNTEYVNTSSKITITCPTRGSFTKRLRVHLNGSGCEQCMYNELVQKGILCGGYSGEFFTRNPHLKSTPGVLYYLKSTTVTIQGRDNYSICKGKNQRS